MPNDADQAIKTGQIFTTSAPSLRGLIESIKTGNLGLPDLQRAFVWKNSQVRDLFDSLYKGFPVGNLLTWRTGADGTVTTVGKVIGTKTEKKAPQLAIVDGQQRLTSAFAVIEGREVERANHSREVIKIAFNPLTSEFKVFDAAVKNDPAFIPDISTLLAVSANMFKAAEVWVARLKKAREVTDEEIDRGQKAIQRLTMIPSYLFTVFEVPATVNPDVVSEIFVRINSRGKKLNQADFLLTMMSVYWDDGRKELEEFCAQAARGQEAPANPYISPSPDQMLRVTVGLGFSRAKLSAMLAVLRGQRVSDTGANKVVDQTAINAQFAIMAEAQEKVLDLKHWTGFLKCLLTAGYLDHRTISSGIAIVATYLHWLIGRTKFGLSETELRTPIATWFFMASLTSRYSAGMESALERELRILDGIKTKEAWQAMMAQECAAKLTPDFWSVTLPGKLATTAGSGPAMSAFYAAQNLLGARALYSDLTISHLLDPAYSSTRAALETHHIFPKAHLQALGLPEQERNQVANFTFAEWLHNSKIGKKPPTEYAPPMAKELPPAALAEMHRLHALPPEWWKLAYKDFLVKRRELMASLIKDAYEKVSGVKTATPAQVAVKAPTAEELIAAGESEIVEYKSTLRKNLHTGQNDEKMELMVLKSLAGFLNARGGTLIVGVEDNGSPVGLGPDSFASEDSMALHLVNIVKQRMGADAMPFIHPDFEDLDGERVFKLRCDPGHRAIFVQEGKEQRFYVRSGPATSELQGTQQHDYIRARFP